MSEERAWSRRGFLTARGIGACAGGMLGALVPDPPRVRDDADEKLVHMNLARRAMACEFSVMIPPLAPSAMAAGEAALDEIQQLEALLTVYSATSAVSYANQAAARKPVRVDARLFGLLERAQALHADTDGAFDIATGSLAKTWGFFDRRPRLPAEEAIADARACSGMGRVWLERETRQVRFDVEGLELNLGSIGKGVAIDAAVRRMREEFGIECVLVQGGQSSMFGLGSPGADARGWLVGIQDPYRAGRRIATVRLRDRALGTSGSAEQFFEASGRRFGHILDPRTGWPADEVASASAIAPDAATADALATAFYVMGLDRTRDFCKNHPEVGALLVLKPGETCRPTALPQVVTFNLTRRDVVVDPDSRSGTEVSCPGGGTG